MHRDNNIFYKVVKKDENSVTDLFCNLMKYDFIRNVLLGFFNNRKNINIPIDEIIYENINTQKRIEEFNKQPDIIIENTNFYCFFEIKIKDSDLQSSQVNEYITQLEKYQNIKKINIIYLIPKGYKYEKNIETEVILHKEYAEIFYWEDFIRYIENTDLSKGSLIVSEFISFLKDVFGKHDLLLTLNLEEMSLFQNPKDLVVAKSLLSKLHKIIDVSAEKVKLYFTENVTFDKVCDTENEYGYNFYYVDEKKHLLFFGLWFSLVEDYLNLSDYFLCYGLNISSDNGDEYFEKKYIENFKKLDNYEKAGDWLIKNFEGKYTLAKDDDNKIIEDISNTLIETIIKLMNK